MKVNHSFGAFLSLSFFRFFISNARVFVKNTMIYDECAALNKAIFRCGPTTAMPFFSFMPLTTLEPPGLTCHAATASAARLVPVTVALLDCAPVKSVHKQHITRMFGVPRVARLGLFKAPTRRLSV